MLLPPLLVLPSPERLLQLPLLVVLYTTAASVIAAGISAAGVTAAGIIAASAASYPLTPCLLLLLPRLLLVLQLLQLMYCYTTAAISNGIVLLLRVIPRLPMLLLSLHYLLFQECSIKAAEGMEGG